MTTDTARHLLFNIDTPEADSLRRQLFRVNDHVTAIPEELQDAVRKILAPYLFTVMSSLASEALAADHDDFLIKGSIVLNSTYFASLN